MAVLGCRMVRVAPVRAAGAGLAIVRVRMQMCMRLRVCTDASVSLPPIVCRRCCCRCSCCSGARLFERGLRRARAAPCLCALRKHLTDHIERAAPARAAATTATAVVQQQPQRVERDEER
eukprot:351344-Chlamydomonas_euryale.AAC.4